MTIKNSKTIVLGISGGIACYKSCELVRLFKKEGHDVHVIMTRAAQEFVTAMTFQTLSQNPVATNLFDLTEEQKIGHIEIADKADVMLVAPATANLIAKAAHGICDDVLTTVLLTTKAPKILAPSMNVNMYENPITQENLRKLESFGFRIIPPESGELACGWEGLGRMAEPKKIFDRILELLKI